MTREHEHLWHPDPLYCERWCLCGVRQTYMEIVNGRQLATTTDPRWAQDRVDAFRATLPLRVRLDAVLGRPLDQHEFSAIVARIAQNLHAVQELIFAQ